MSPNPGEPGHDTRGWTHLVCADCWYERNPDRDPVTIKNDSARRCCGCGSVTSDGIYIREAAASIHARREEQQP